MTTRYLSLARAEFEYEATTEEELSVREDQLVWVLENDDPDWHKVKIKTTDATAAPAIGLVPASYLAPSVPLRAVTALYDYTPAVGEDGQLENDEEMEIAEGEQLELLEEEEEWILVQRADGGGAGFVPASYVEDGDASAAAPIVEEDEPIAAPVVTGYSDAIPPPPTRAAAPPAAAAGNVKTWAVTELDKKKKKKKGTLGVGNGAVFFASETDKTPVQQYPLSTLTDLKHEKSKHLHLTFPSSGELHFVISSKSEFDDILAKIEEDRGEVSAPSPVAAPAAPAPPPAPPAPVASAYIPPPPPIRGAAAAAIPPPIRTASSSASIPVAPPAPTRNGSSTSTTTNATALYDFDSAGEDELSLVEGERVFLLIGASDDPEWAKIRKNGQEGVVPASYVELDAAGGEEDEEAARVAEEERLADEAALAAQLEADAKAVRDRQVKVAGDREAREAARRKELRAEEARQNRLSQAPKAGPIPVPVRGEVQQLQDEEEERQLAPRRPKDKPERDSGRDRERERERERESGSREGSSRREAKERSSSGKDRAVRKPDTSRVRTWKDRTGQFKVEAEFLGLKDNKIRLHKLNGVIIEVPVEKMSSEDTAYLKRELGGGGGGDRREAPRQRSSRPSVEVEPPTPQRPSSKPKPRSNTDWFDFFLNAGCDMDNCTRYARNADNEGFDESLIPDLEESNLRSLGLKEGDIIRVKKYIREKYHAGAHRPPPTPDKTDREAQIAADAVLAKALQNGTPTTPAPNLFASGPNGELKPRRGRRNTTTSGRQDTVDGAALASAGSELAKVRGTTPTNSAPERVASPQSSGSSSLDPHKRSSSTIPQLGGFDDDAWDIKPTSKAATPSPAPAPAAPTPPPAPAPPAAPIAQPPAAEQPARAGSAGPASGSTLTYNDGLLAQLGINNRPPSAPVTSQPTGFQMSPQPTGASYNGPRAPVAPIAANQGLLAPLVPTRTGFPAFSQAPMMPMATGFVPQMQPNFTGMPMMSQPTGFGSLPAPMGMQPTGSPNFLQGQPTGYQQPQQTGFQQPQQTGFQQPQSTGYMQPQATGMGFQPQQQQQGYQQTPQRFSPAPQQQQQQPVQFNPLPPGQATSAPPASSTPAQFDPSNIFSSMKDGSFVTKGSNLGPQDSTRYDALRPQPTGMPFQGLQPQATGFPQQQQMQPQMTGFPGQQQQMFPQATGMPQQFGQNGFMPRQF